MAMLLVCLPLRCSARNSSGHVMCLIRHWERVGWRFWMLNWPLTSALVDVARVSWSHVLPLSPLHRAGTQMVFARVRYAAFAYCKGRNSVIPCLRRCYNRQYLSCLNTQTMGRPSSRATSLSIARRAAKLTRVLSHAYPQDRQPEWQGRLADGHRIADNVRRGEISTTHQVPDSRLF